ncbi:MAG: YHS domain-containing protein [Thermoanaerobaculia bacterium]
MNRSRMLLAAVAVLLLPLALFAQGQGKAAPAPKPVQACPHMTTMSNSIDQAITLLETAMAGPDNIKQAVALLKKAKDQGDQCQAMCAEKMCGSGGHDHAAMAGANAAAAKVTDPVCGMTVDPAKAPKSTYAGKTYYFCSAEDKAKFDKDPASFVKKG